MSAARVLRAWLAGMLLLALAATSAAGQQATTSLGAQGGSQLEVTADSGIEWQKDRKVYIARGNAQVRRGSFSVRAATLTAHYRDNAEGRSEIYRVEAVGGVVLRNGGDVARGDRATYDVDRKVLTMTGSELSYVSGAATITSRDSLEYWEVQGTAVARGDAKAVRENDTVRADMLVGHFENRARADEPGRSRRELAQIDAIGNVEISNGGNVATAARATYDTASKQALLTGGVQITRGSDRLNGDRAEVNMETGVYRMLPGAPGTPGGRVTGTITPDRTPPGNAAPPPAPAPVPAPAPGSR